MKSSSYQGKGMVFVEIYNTMSEDEHWVINCDLAHILVSSAFMCVGLETRLHLYFHKKY